MNKLVHETETFRQSMKRLPSHSRKIVWRKVQLLAGCRHHHPSLQTHRVLQSKENLWIAYISKSLRLLYQYKDNTIYLHDVGTHAIVDKVQLRNFTTRSQLNQQRECKQDEMK